MTTVDSRWCCYEIKRPPFRLTKDAGGVVNEFVNRWSRVKIPSSAYPIRRPQDANCAILNRNGMLVPILETDRLKLRGHRLEDFEACAAVWADPAVVRYISGKPSTRTQSWLRMLAYGGHWQHVPFGYWAVEEKKTGRYIGDVGFADF